MRIRTLMAAAMVYGGIAAIGAAQADDGLTVNNWPGDVPCSAITNNHDGSYTLNQTVVFGNGDDSYTIAAGNVFQTDAEYKVWADKCGS